MDRLDEELVKETVETALGFSAFKVCHDAAVPDVIAWNGDAAGRWVSRTGFYGVIVVMDCRWHTIFRELNGIFISF